MNKNSKNSNQLNNDNEEQSQTPKINKKLLKLAEKEEKNVQNEQQMLSMMESLMAKKMQEFEEKRQKEKQEWEEKLRQKDEELKKQMDEQQKKLDDMKKEMEEQMKKKYKKKEKLPVSNLDGFMTWEQVQKEINVIWRYYFDDNPVNWYLSGYVHRLRWRDFAAEKNESITRVVMRARDHSNLGKFPRWTILFTKSELKWDEALDFSQGFPGFNQVESPSVGPFTAKEDLLQRQMRDPQFFKYQQQLASEYSYQLKARRSYDFLPIQIAVEDALVMRLLGYDKKEEVNKLIPPILNLEFFEPQQYGKKRKQRMSNASSINIEKEEVIDTYLIDRVMKKMELAQEQLEQQQNNEDEQENQQEKEDEKMSEEEESEVVEVKKDEIQKND